MRTLCLFYNLQAAEDRKSRPLFPDVPPGLGTVAEDVLDKLGVTRGRAQHPWALCPVAVDASFLLVYKTQLTAAGNTGEMEPAVSVRLRHKASIPRSTSQRD